MDKRFVFLLIFFGGFQGCSGKEKKCSKLDFQEKVLEKLVRIEHKMEMTESSNELSLQVKDDIQKMKADLANMSGNTQENLTEIKKDLEILKGELVEREKVLNDTIKMKITELSGKNIAIWSFPQGPKLIQENQFPIYS